MSNGDAVVMAEELKAIDELGTIGPAEVVASSTKAAFLAGFAAVRAGKKAPRVARDASRAEAFAFRHGVAEARISRTCTAEEALASFLVIEGFWANSAMQCSIEAYREAKAAR